jgi:hypothetical protein
MRCLQSLFEQRYPSPRISSLESQLPASYTPLQWAKVRLQMKHDQEGCPRRSRGCEQKEKDVRPEA